MARSVRANYAVLAFLALLGGCAGPAGRSGPTSLTAVAHPSRRPLAHTSESRRAAATPPAVSQVAFQPPAETAPELLTATDEPAGHSAEPSDASDPFLGQAELSVGHLVAEVEARNPSLQAVSEAWRAATERCPQVVSLDDPMFTAMMSPGGVGMDRGGGWMVQAAQKIPWPGKRALRGTAAEAEADVMQGDVGDTRLRLAEAARTAFYDYYLARRQSEVNASTRKLVTRFREIAWNKYQVGQATQQDVLQADVELASLESRRTELARDGEVAMARINTLLHRGPDHPVPPPPAKVPLPDSLPAAEALQQAAVESRPDLFARQARIRAEEANLALACREYYPDVNLVARYDGFMPEDMRPQVGVDVNVPLRNARRSAAVREASSRIAQRRAEYEDRLDQVRYEVQSAWSRASQSQRIVRLYEEKILPAAQRSLDSALANYTSGKLDFLRLIDAQRQLNAQREIYYQAIAECHRRLAELERAVGQPVGTNP